jgi:hypothetical protein
VEDEETQRKIAMHELGHTPGLRHEFAVAKEPKSGALSIGPRDDLSIMTYNFGVNDLTDDDVAETIELHALPAGPFIGAWR